jgi:hypothetical protein
MGIVALLTLASLACAFNFAGIAELVIPLVFGAGFAYANSLRKRCPEAFTRIGRA